MKPNKGDFYTLIMKEKEYYNISLSDSQICSMSKSSYKKYLDERIYRTSFCEFSQSTKSKLQNLLRNVKPDKHGRFQMQKYLKTNELSTREKQSLFSLRCRSFDVKSNYKSLFSENMTCRICKDPNSYEDEIHTFNCDVLTKDESMDPSIKLEHIFGSLKQQIKATKHYFKLMQKRRLILDIGESSS